MLGQVVVDGARRDPAGADQQQWNVGRRADGVDAQLDVADRKKSLHTYETA